MKRLWLGSLLLLPLTAAAAERAKVLPAAELLRAIAQSEFHLEGDLFSRGNDPIAWLPSASPYAGLSWLMLNLSDRSLVHLKHNADDSGKPLL